LFWKHNILPPSLVTQLRTA